MKVIRDRLGLSSAPQRGFTLIEVMVATLLLGMLTTLSLALYVSGMNATTAQQRRDIGITIANETMESVVAWQVSGLVTGRSELAVKAQWDAASGLSGISESTPRWDDDATPADVASIPLARTVNRLGTVYNVQTYIGACEQPIVGGDCKKSVALDKTELLRVIIVVGWTAGDACASGGCTYQATTLIEPTSKDLEWKQSG